MENKKDKYEALQNLITKNYDAFLEFSNCVNVDNFDSEKLFELLSSDGFSFQASALQEGGRILLNKLPGNSFIFEKLLVHERSENFIVCKETRWLLMKHFENELTDEMLERFLKTSDRRVSNKARLLIKSRKKVNNQESYNYVLNLFNT